MKFSDEKLLDTSKSENMTINTEKKKKKDKQAEDEIEIEKKKKKAKKNKDTERKSSHREEKPTVAAAAPPPQPPVTTITTAISPSSTKEDKEKQREVIWRLEIERKIRQEASEKGIELTSEQFQKVCERRMKKLGCFFGQRQKIFLFPLEKGLNEPFFSFTFFPGFPKLIF